MEARQQDLRPFAKHPPHHARLPPKERVELPLGLAAGEAILFQQANGIANPVAEIFLGDQHRDHGFDAVTLPPAPILGGMQPDIIGDALMLDFLGSVPAPDIRSDRIGTFQIARIGQQMVADDGGEMFERNGDRQIEFFRTPFGQCQHRLNALIDAFDIIAVVGNQPVERDMFPRVVDFLRCERFHFLSNLRRHGIAEHPHRVDKECFAAWQAGRN